jgi:hypothetical protein
MEIGQLKIRSCYGNFLEEDATEAGKTWNEVKRLATNRSRWRSFTKELQELRRRW